MFVSSSVFRYVQEIGVPFFRISAPEIVSGMSGESEAKIRNLFASAQTMAPSIIFIDEVDSITPKREHAAREMERRIVSQLLTCMDRTSVHLFFVVSSSLSLFVEFTAVSLGTLVSFSPSPRTIAEYFSP